MPSPSKIFFVTVLGLTVCQPGFADKKSSANKDAGIKEHKEYVERITITPDEFENAKAIEKKDKGALTQYDWWGVSENQRPPVPDGVRPGYWWWPSNPEKEKLWGNRGLVYVWRVIPGDLEEGTPAMVLKKILYNVKVYFAYDKYTLRDDELTSSVLEKAQKIIKKNPQASILIEGHADARGSEKYNYDLGQNRAKAVQNYMLASGVSADRIKIISKGKLEATAPIYDFEGMQKDRNAQFMIAEVMEIPIPQAELENYQNSGTPVIEQQEYETSKDVSFDRYVTQKGDTLWKIANEYYGKPHRWKNIFNANRDVLPNPNRVQPGLALKIPRE